MIKVLIVDGQNNHDHWPKITYMLKEYMEDTNLFSVDVARTAYTWKGEEFLPEFTVEGVGKTTALEEPKADPGYNPDFSAYDVVVCNFGWNAAPWPNETQRKFEQYVKGGGGLVVFHAADNSFPDWKAYNRMIGLGGWGDRNEEDGPLVYYNDAGETGARHHAGQGRRTRPAERIPNTDQKPQPSDYPGNARGMDAHPGRTLQQPAGSGRKHGGVGHGLFSSGKQGNRSARTGFDDAHLREGPHFFIISWATPTIRWPAWAS